MELHVYDIFMVVVILVATLFGAWKGMAWQIASLSALVASYFVALHFSPALAPHLSAEAPWNKFLAMLIIYVVTSAGIWTAFQIVSKAIERVKLQEFDQQVGAIFGAFKGVVLCVAITFFAVTLSQRARDTILHTRSGYYAALILEKAEPIMPAELRRVLEPHLERFDRATQQPAVAGPASWQPETAAGEAWRSAEQLQGTVQQAREAYQGFQQEFSTQPIMSPPVPSTYDVGTRPTYETGEPYRR